MKNRSKVLFFSKVLSFFCLIAVCLVAAPGGPPQVLVPDDARNPVPKKQEVPLTKDRFEHLARNDRLAMLEASLNHYNTHVRDYTCKLHKQERLNGVLGEKEVIDVKFREKPFSVHLKWLEGFGIVLETLYVQKENNNNALVKIKVPILGPKTTEVEPNSNSAKERSRFSIEDFGLANGTRRAYKAWTAAAECDQLKVEYVKTELVPELGRVCHIVRRTVDPPEVDNFSMTDKGVRSPKDFPAEAIGSATLMFDAELFVLVGSVIERPDKSLLATYYFRDLDLNAKLKREDFLRKVLEQK